jgi:hypothetical protein
VTVTKLPDDHHVRWHPQLQVEVPPVDPVTVQGEVDAYLVQRGQHIAQDMDLGHVTDDDLARLGELDAIGQHPDVDPALAIALETIATARDHNPFEDWHTRHAHHQGHRHAINETCTDPGPGHRPSFTRGKPDIPDIGDRSGLDPGPG